MKTNNSVAGNMQGEAERPKRSWLNSACCFGFLAAACVALFAAIALLYLIVFVQPRL